MGARVHHANLELVDIVAWGWNVISCLVQVRECAVDHERCLESSMDPSVVLDRPGHSPNSIQTAE